MKHSEFSFLAVLSLMLIGALGDSGNSCTFECIFSCDRDDKETCLSDCNCDSEDSTATLEDEEEEFSEALNETSFDLAAFKESLLKTKEDWVEYK